MQELIQTINQFISTHQAWAGPIIALLCLGESLLLVGLMIPATAILIFTGALIGAGTLSPIPIALWGIVGAIIGDSISYYIGRYLGWDVTKKPLLVPYRSFFVRAKLFFRKYGTLSVFLGRFMGPIRSTIPTVAGIMGLNHIKFQIANIASAILWLPTMLAPGYFSAKGTQAIAESTGSSLLNVITILSVVGSIIIILYFFVPRKRKKDSHER